MMPLTVTIAAAIADSVAASGDATPTVMMVTSHITAAMMPMMPAMTLRMLQATSRHSDSEAIQLASFSYSESPPPQLSFSSHLPKPPRGLASHRTYVDIPPAIIELMPGTGQ